MPVPVYRVVGESTAQTRFDVAHPGASPRSWAGSTRWRCSGSAGHRSKKPGAGDLLSGEAGIGKSRLVQAFRGQLAGETHADRVQLFALLSAQCLLSRGRTHTTAPAFRQDDTPEEKLRSWKTRWGLYASLEEVVPLFAALLSLPLPSAIPPSR